MLNLARNEVILRRPFLDFNFFICWEHNDCEMFHLGQTYHGPQWADCCFFTQSTWESQLLSWASVPVIVSLSLHLYCLLNISILPSNLHSCHFFPTHLFHWCSIDTHKFIQLLRDLQYVTKMGICLLYNFQTYQHPSASADCFSSYPLQMQYQSDEILDICVAFGLDMFWSVYIYF